MKTYFVRRGGSRDDAAIRAADEEDARSLVPNPEEAELGEIDQKIANAMLIPEGRGRHKGVVTRWMLGPTTPTGDLAVQGFSLVDLSERQIIVQNVKTKEHYDFGLGDDGELLGEHIGHRGAARCIENLGVQGKAKPKNVTVNLKHPAGPPMSLAICASWGYIT
jgi:hypothetical protein